MKVPNFCAKSLPPLYKRTKTGATQYWIVESQGNKVRTRHGQVDGIEQVGAWTVVTAKNVGRSNSLTAEEQAVAHAKMAWDKQLRRNGYREVIEDIDDAPKFEPPMLALEYEKQKNKVVFPVRGDPKLNGVRGFHSCEGMFSRKGVHYMAFPHVEEAAARFFSDYPEARIDGELYNHELRWVLNRISGLARKKKLSAADLEFSRKHAKHYVYDGYLCKDDKRLRFTVRNAKLENVLQKYPELMKVIELVPHVKLVSHEAIEKHFKDVVGEDYEGSIIRQELPYEHCRSKALLKYKPWKTAEFPIDEVVEGIGKRKGTAGAIWHWYTPKGKKPVRFKSNVKGNTAFVTRVWRDRLKLKGKPATVEFAYYSEYDVPQHGYTIEIRDYE